MIETINSRKVEVIKFSDLPFPLILIGLELKENDCPKGYSPRYNNSDIMECNGGCKGFYFVAMGYVRKINHFYAITQEKNTSAAIVPDETIDTIISIEDYKRMTANQGCSFDEVGISIPRDKYEKEIYFMLCFYENLKNQARKVTPKDYKIYGIVREEFMNYSDGIIWL